MFPLNLRLSAFLVPLVLAGFGLSLARGADEDDVPLPAFLKAKPIPAASGDDEVRKLLKERYNAAVAETKDRYLVFASGRATLDSLFDAARRLVHSGLELNDKPADRVALLTGYLELARLIEKTSAAGQEAGRIPSHELEYARYMRADAELQLVRAKKAAAGK